MSSSRLFAVVPAAGKSRRMGGDKLLLPLGDQPVIRRLLDVLDQPEITETIVVVRPADEPIARVVSETSARIIRPEYDPPEMRDSVTLALAEIADRYQPSPDDGWLLCPADHPMLSAEVLKQLFDCWRDERPLILLPTCGGRRGHPTLFRWSLTAEIAAIPLDEGLNRIVHDHADEVREMAVDEEAILFDLDTPEDYTRAAARWGKE